MVRVSYLVFHEQSGTKDGKCVDLGIIEIIERMRWILSILHVESGNWRTKRSRAWIGKVNYDNRIDF